MLSGFIPSAYAANTVNFPITDPATVLQTVQGGDGNSIVGNIPHGSANHFYLQQVTGNNNSLLVTQDPSYILNNGNGSITNANVNVFTQGDANQPQVYLDTKLTGANDHNNVNMTINGSNNGATGAGVITGAGLNALVSGKSNNSTTIINGDNNTSETVIAGNSNNTWAAINGTFSSIEIQQSLFGPPLSTNSTAIVSTKGNYNSLLAEQSGDSNQSTISAIGDNNNLSTEQGNNGNTFNVTASGNRNTLETWQEQNLSSASGKSNNLATVNVSGDNNLIFAVNQVGNNNVANVSLTGSNNNIGTYADLNNPFDQTSIDRGLFQNGSGNSMGLAVTGDGNSISAIQVGSSNKTTHIVNGSGNAIAESTYGNNNTLYDSITGSGNKLTTTVGTPLASSNSINSMSAVYGNNNTIAKTLNGSNNNSSVNIGLNGVSSSNNNIALTQNGKGNSASVIFTNGLIYGSGYNTVNATQAGNDSFYAVVQGSHNTLNITQAANKTYGGILSVIGRGVTVTKTQSALWLLSLPVVRR